MSARLAPLPMPHVCSVQRCGDRAVSDTPGDPAPFCAHHWRFLKTWQRRAVREAFEEKRWNDYGEVVRLCADDLDTKEGRARELGFQGLVLARHFSKDHPRGVVVRMMGRSL